MADVMGLRMDIERSLERAGRWLGEGSTWLSDDQQALDNDRHRLAALRGRAASALINVAMLGAFSSGRTFLLSGLQGGLELRMVGRGPQYIGLLPSDTRPTTSSPATVEPTVADQADVSRDYGGRGFLRVRFSDSQGWEDIGPSQSPATIAAYASVQPDPTVRRESDWNRQVEEVQILLGNFLLHAKLYDLPGHGSTNPAHEAIVRARMRDAASSTSPTRLALLTKLTWDSSAASMNTTKTLGSVLSGSSLPSTKPRRSITAEIPLGRPRWRPTPSSCGTHHVDEILLEVATLESLKVFTRWVLSPRADQIRGTDAELIPARLAIDRHDH